MTLRIETTVPAEIVAKGTAGDYLADCFAAIGFVREAAKRSNNYDRAVHAEDAPVSFAPNPPAEAQIEIEVQPEETSSEPAPQRERGKPAPGKARRTKAEIEEDEAADAEDARLNAIADERANDGSAPIPSDLSETPTDKPAISTGEERISPEDDAAAEQDAADEAADPANAPAAEATRDDVRTAMMGYSEKHGLPALTTRLTAIFNEKFPGQGVTKLSEIPEDAAAFQSVIDALNAEG